MPQELQTSGAMSQAAEVTAPLPSACRGCGGNQPADFLRAPDRFHGDTRSFTLVRCRICELVYLANAPEPEELGKHYGTLYDRFISRAGGSGERWRDRSAALHNHVTGGSLLDLGCSSGAFLGSLDRNKWKLFGIEISAEAAKAAKAATGAEIFVGDIMDAPFPANSFDAITCFDVLEHVYNPRLVLEKVQYWLKPSGVFYTLLPNIDSGESRLFGSYWYGLELPRHLSHFSLKSLHALAGSVGLEPISVEARRNSALEYSLRYVGDDLLKLGGIRRASLAEAGEPSIAWKVTRKALRMTAYRIVSSISTLFGEGESIHSFFRKPGSVEKVN